MSVLFILPGEEDFCFMAENQFNYIAVCKTFIIFGVANSTCFRTLRTNNNDAYENISNSPNTALSLLSTDLLQDKDG